MSTSQQLETLVEITNILNGSLPFSEKFDSVLAVLAEFTGSGLVTLRELEPETATLRLIASYNLMVPSDDISMHVPSYAYLSDNPLDIKSPITNYSGPETPPQVYVAGVNSALSLPIEVDGKFFGTLAFGSSSTGHYPEDTVRLLVTIGVVIGMMIGNAKIQENLSRSDTLLEEAPLGIIVADDNGVMIQTNRHLEKLFGYNREELLGGRCVEILVPESLRGSHTDHRAGYFRNPSSLAHGRGITTGRPTQRWQRISSRHWP